MHEHAEHAAVFTARGEANFYVDSHGNLILEAMTEDEPIRRRDGTTVALVISAKDRRKQRETLTKVARMLRDDARRRV